MPHITEELWALLGFAQTADDTIQFTAPPQPSAIESAEARRKVNSIYNTVRAGRNLRAESRVPSNKRVPFVLRAGDSTVAEELPTLARLLNAEQLLIEPAYTAATGVPVAVTDLGELYLVTEINADAGAERERLEKEIAKLENELKATNRKLANSSFVDRAPADVVEEHRQRVVKFTEKLAQLRTAREGLQ